MLAAYQKTRGAIAALAIAVCLPGAGNAAQNSLLPIVIGTYLNAPSGDCDVPDAMGWDGKGFGSDYIYLDNIIQVRKMGQNQFAVTSRTKIDDEGSAHHGKIWHGIIKVESPTVFYLKQYSSDESESAETFIKFYLCHK